MPSARDKARAATASSTIVIFVLLTGAWRVARAIEPLPADIPEKTVTAEESLRQAAEAMQRIEDPKERLNVAARALYDLRSLGRDKLLPILAVVERDAKQWDDKSLLLRAAESLAIVDPDLLLKLAQDVGDERTRDFCLRYYAGGGARLDLAKARQAVAEIKNPERRAEALVRILNAARFDLPELKEIVVQIEALGWPANHGSRAYTVGSALLRTPPERFDEALNYVRDKFEPDEAVLMLCHMAGQLRYFHKKPELAARAMTAAADLVPACGDRAGAVRWLLHYRYARVDRERAAALFHEHVLAPAEKKPDRYGIVAGLAEGGIDFAVCHARLVARDLPGLEEQVLEAVFQKAGTNLEPDEVLAWLRQQPPGALRDLAVAQVATGLWHRDRNTAIAEELRQQLVDVLSKQALSITDPSRRRKACEAIFLLARYSNSKSRMEVPQELKEEYRRLRLASGKDVTRGSTDWDLMLFVGLLPEAAQEEEIRRHWERSETRTAASRLQNSSLKGEVRKGWYGKLLAQARANPNKFDRRSALSGIAACLEDEDPARAIAVLWEALEMVKPFKPSQAWNHDVGDDIGPVSTPWNPDEALSSMFLDFRGIGDPAIKALWEHAQKLESAEEREPVLEALGRILAEQKKFAQAAGLTSLVASPERQGRIWVEIAAEQHAIPHKSRQ